MPVPEPPRLLTASAAAHLVRRGQLILQRRGLASGAVQRHRGDGDAAGVQIQLLHASHQRLDAHLRHRNRPDTAPEQSLELVRALSGPLLCSASITEVSFLPTEVYVRVFQP